ncbi:MAG: chorismate lyase [Halieaceae bacterium]|nr:chorismate lyase [Halieaceae bacterium]
MTVSSNLVWRSEHEHIGFTKRPPRALFDRGSLTQILRGLGHLSVNKRLQDWRVPYLDEQLLLQAKASRDFALTREVSLHVNGEPFVFARSILPNLTLQGPNRFLRQWDSRPLGEFLFSHRQCQRSLFQYTRMAGSHVMLPRDLRSTETLWGRRSLFYLHQQPLIVAEFYLPAFLDCLVADLQT